MGEHSWPWAAGLAHKNAALSAPYCPPRLEPQVAGGQPKATGGEPGLSRSRVRWVRYLLSLHTTRTHATKYNHVLEGRFVYKLLLSLTNRRWPERESNPRHADFQSLNNVYPSLPGFGLILGNSQLNPSTSLPAYALVWRCFAEFAHTVHTVDASNQRGPGFPARPSPYEA